MAIPQSALVYKARVESVWPTFIQRVLDACEWDREDAWKEFGDVPGLKRGTFMAHLNRSKPRAPVNRMHYIILREFFNARLDVTDPAGVGIRMPEHLDDIIDIRAVRDDPTTKSKVSPHESALSGIAA